MNYKEASLIKKNLSESITLLNNFDEQEPVFDISDRSDCLVMSILEITEFKLVTLLDIFENEKQICMNCESIYFFIMIGAYIEMVSTQKVCKEVSELIDQLSARFDVISDIFTKYSNFEHEHNHFVNPLFTKAELN